MVIPEIIRESLHMEVGTQFIVIGLDDTIVLKSISPPPMSKFKSLLAKADKAAKDVMQLSLKLEKLKTSKNESHSRY